MYICDKCGTKINYGYRKGRNVYKYYSYNPRTYAPKKDFDLCSICEKKFRKWLKEKEMPTTLDLIENFPRLEE
jgi:hypothetical protein